jgi:hypothetical protein
MRAVLRSTESVASFTTSEMSSSNAGLWGIVVVAPELLEEVPNLGIQLCSTLPVGKVD